jgi:hypothetical protein
MQFFICARKAIFLDYPHDLSVLSCGTQTGSRVRPLPARRPL